MGRSRRKNFKPLECVVYDPKWNVEYKSTFDWSKSPIALGEVVLFMGNIPNVIGHCAVAKHTGEVIWLVHPEDFRTAREDEL
jgi:hypothetical protein